MSSKHSSLAVDEVKEQHDEKVYDRHFEPELKVLVNKRFINGSDTAATRETVSIGGRITISF